MAYLDWSDALSVGVPLIDVQHKRLVALVNRLHDAMGERKGQAILAGILDELVKYTIMHFSTEERMMDESRYPDRAAHAAEHNKLTARVGELQKELAAGKLFSIDLMDFLTAWLTNHIMKVDKRYGPHLQKHAAREAVASR